MQCSKDYTLKCASEEIFISPLKDLYAIIDNDNYEIPRKYLVSVVVSVRSL